MLGYRNGRWRMEEMLFDFDAKVEAKGKLGTGERRKWRSKRFKKTEGGGESGGRWYSIV